MNVVFRRVAPILATGVLVIVSSGIGFYAGQKTAYAKTIQNGKLKEERFEKISDTEALDRETGQVCITKYVMLNSSTNPSINGYHLDLPQPYCADLAK